jgi:methylated-DNA-protein-cysteine methyltransferase-like protein
MAILTLFERPDCHLCAEMRAELAAWASGADVQIELIDIDSEAALVERYGDKVPVLAEGDYEICHYFLDVKALEAHLEERAAARSEPRESLRTASRYERIYAVVRQIPPGRVATYGQVAAIEGNATARQVGYAMAAVTEVRRVPWQRVINSRGTVSERSGGGGTGRQRLLLQSEGIVFDRRGRVDFGQVAWQGPAIDWLERHGFHPAPMPVGAAPRGAPSGRGRGRAPAQ